MIATGEKEITVEMPLKAVKELQEVYRDVLAFSNVMIKLADEDDTLARLFKPIEDRFTGSMMVIEIWSAKAQGQSGE